MTLRLVFFSVQSLKVDDTHFSASGWRLLSGTAVPHQESYFDTAVS